MQDLYEILGLPKDCTQEQIKHQFRILARIHHPDMGGDVEKFKEIKLAYEVLSDPERRAEYDKSGAVNQRMDILQEARMNLSNLFFMVLPNINPDTDNILDICKNELEKSIENLEKDKINNSIYISKLNLVKSKIRVKDELEIEDIFSSFLTNALDARQNDLNTFDRRIEVAKEMLKIIDRYHYGFFELQNVITGGGGFRHE